MSERTAEFLADPVAALSGWDLAVDGWQVLDGGNANASVVIESGSARLVATLCLDKSEGEARALCELYEHLALHGFPAAQLVRTRQGAPLGELGGVPLMVKSWVPGQVVARPSLDQLASLGEELARLHRVRPCEALPVDHLFGLPQVAEVVGSGVDPEFGDALRARVEALRTPLFALEPRGLVHGDVFVDNVVFSDDGPTLIDFEEATTAPLALDLGMAVVGTCVQGAALLPGAVRALLEGYERLRVLTDAELAALPACAELAALACGSWRCWRYKLVEQVPHKALAHREMWAISEVVRRGLQAG